MVTQFYVLNPVGGGGGLLHKRQSNKSRRPLGASLEFTFGMYFSEGSKFC
jgi:hypothetical protein